ncbi:MAG: sigma-70 family RNA polymerase sigma factor [Deltaproteobacteria bacterium]|nr:sigma-70 family RNA polymerase sigma factor [Nannocystaceae bacterium]
MNDRGAGSTDSLQFAAIYREQGAFVYRILRRLGVPVEALEDATQDVFMVVHRRWDAYDREVPIRSWLFGITRRVAADTRKRMHRLASRSEGRADTERIRDPADVAARAEASDFVARFLDTLDEDKRVVFVLADVEGLTAPEIGAALGVNLNTIYARLRAARLRFMAARREWTGAAAEVG